MNIIRLTTTLAAQKIVCVLLSPQKSADVTQHFSVGRVQILCSCKSNVRKDNQECGAEDTDHFDGEKERNCSPTYMPNHGILLGSAIRFCTYIVCLFDSPHVFSVPSCPCLEDQDSRRASSSKRVVIHRSDVLWPKGRWL